jgi:hypothetical protein
MQYYQQLRFAATRLGSPRDNDVDFEPDKLGRGFSEALVASLSLMIFNGNSSIFDPAEFAVGSSGSVRLVDPHPAASACRVRLRLRRPTSPFQGKDGARGLGLDDLAPVDPIDAIEAAAGMLQVGSRKDDRQTLWLQGGHDLGNPLGKRRRDAFERFVQQ